MRKLALAIALAACGGNSSSNPDAAVDAGFDAGPCPDQHGSYSVVLAGQGCGDTSMAGDCITQSACTITLASSSPGGSLSGTASVAMDGSFTGAAITEG